MTKRLYIILTILALALVLIGCGLTQRVAPSQPVQPIQTTQSNQANQPKNSTQNNQPAPNSSPNNPGNPALDLPQPTPTPPAKLKVHILNVGQADCILLQTPDGKNLLIDAGNNADQAAILAYLKQQNLKRLDVVIGTHPHEDHIGSLDAVISNFDIGQVIMPKVTTNTETFRDMLAAIKAKGLKITTAKAGITLKLGSKLTACLTAPNSTKYQDLNNYSAVLKVSYGQTSFLFVGDAEKLSEAEMLKNGSKIQADVLKVGHHGSKDSTTKAFLKAVKPKFALISVSADNKYGHPAQLTLDKLVAAKVKVYRTDRTGTIVLESDGGKISIAPEM